MAVQIQYRRGTEQENDAFTGALGEITVDTTNGTLRVHDGTTAGGTTLATEPWVENLVSPFSTSEIYNGTSNVKILSSGGNVNINVGGTRIVEVLPNGITVVANVTADNLHGNVYTNLIDTQDGSSGITITPEAIFANGVSVAGELEASANVNIDGVLTLNDTLVPFSVAGNLNPSANVTYSLGNTTNRWNDLYLAGNSIFLANATFSANTTSVIITGPEGAEFVLSGNSAANTVLDMASLDVSGNLTAGTLTVDGNIVAANVSATDHLFSGNVDGWLSDEGVSAEDRRIMAVANIAGPVEIAVVNESAANLAYSEFIAMNDVGNIDQGWISMGINSSTYDDPSFPITKADGGYLLYEAPAGTTAGGNLVIGTGTNGANNYIVFGAGGFATGNVQMLIMPDEQVHIEIPTVSTNTATGALRVGGGMGLTGNLNMGGQLNVAGNITVGDTSTVLANNFLANNHVYSGPVEQWLTDQSEADTGRRIAAVANIAGAAEILTVNQNAGNLSYSEFLAINDVGNVSQGWISMGINSSTYDDPSFQLTMADEGYILFEAPANTSGSGNLVIATGGNGSNNSIVFGAGGFATGNTQMVIIPDLQVHIEIPTTSTSTTTGALRVAGGMGLTGNLNMGGNLTASETSYITANNITANNWVHSGEVNAWLTAQGESEEGRRIIAVANIAGAAEIASVNESSGNLAYGEFIAINDVGNIEQGWISMGINSSLYDDPAFLLTQASDGYLLFEAPTDVASGGNLIIATGSNGNVNAIKFGAGGFGTGNTQMIIFPDQKVEIVIPTDSTSTTTGALVIDGGLGLTGNLNVGGDVNIVGNITLGGSGNTIDVSALVVDDPLIFLGANNAADLLDLGFVGQYNAGGNLYNGLVRDATDGVFKFFANIANRPNTEVDFSDANLVYPGIKAGSANLTASTTSTSTTTGALIVAGGVGIGGETYVGGQVIATGNVSGGNLVTGGLVSATGNVGGGNLVTGGVVQSTGNVIGGNLTTAGVVQSTGNVIGGNLVTAGAAAVTGNISGGNLAIAANATVTGNVNAGNFSTSATLSAANIIISALANVTSTTAATSTTTGALQVAGGAGVVGNLHVGGLGQFTGNITGGNLNTGAQVVATGNITGGNLVTAGAVSTIEIIKTGSNGVGNIGSSSNYFNTVYARATSALYADLAEKYLADQSYPPGTVVEIGGTAEVTQTTTPASSRVIGVVSTDPAFLMNTGLDDTAAVSVALTGRVPCLVKGRIRRGDLLISSDSPGVATAIDHTVFVYGSVIGKALEDHDSEGLGVIEVVVGRL
jgi:hypothetical protein